MRNFSRISVSADIGGLYLGYVGFGRAKMIEARGVVTKSGVVGSRPFCLSSDKKMAIHELVVRRLWKLMAFDEV